MKNLTRQKKIRNLIIALVLFIVITNPSILPLPGGVKNWLYDVWYGVFGNVEDIISIIRLNWISIFKIIVIVIVLALLYNIVKLILAKFEPKSGKGKSLYSLLNSFTIYTFALIGLIWCLTAIGVNISTIFASIGIVALIVGFAAESLIEDVITGLFLLFENEFNVGDIIEYNGFRGTVTKIGIRITCITDAGGNIKMANNSDIRNVLNKSKEPSAAVIDVPISYAANLENAEKVLKGILAQLPKKYPDVFDEAPVYLGVQALDASSVNLRISANVSEDKIFRAMRLMNREVKLGMDKANVEIPFQQVVVHQAK